MKLHRKILSISGVLAYSMGILLGLVLSGWSTWGEIEAAWMVFRTGEGSIQLHCPLMLDSTEMGSVSASFDNPTEDVIHPTIHAVIGHAFLPRTESTVLTLATGENKQLRWTVGPDDMVFGGLILVNVFETSQRNFPSHQGSCGILFSRFPGLSGKWIFIFMFIVSLICIGSGATLWVTGASPLRGEVEEATKAGFVLAGIVFADMLLILPRWWALSGFFFLAAIMLIVIVITQFVLFPM